MLLRRSLFVLDIIALLAIVVFLVFLPADRCLNFEASEQTPRNVDKKCHLHPVHHPNFSFTENLKTNDHLIDPSHQVTICHRLKWSHYSFWDSMYLILLPALTCVFLIFYTVLEICEFDVFVGQVQTTGLVIVSAISVIYSIAVITHEKNRIETEWPLLAHAYVLGAKEGETTVNVPKTWQYSIAMCILSALFKIGRVLVQHFIGDKKFFFDDDSQRDDQNGEPVLLAGSEEVAGTTTILNDSRYSRIETD
ncbi:uncharacterized protein CELE_C28C12.11 [Caenorhabditis elegans]|uniref:Transmembrane protein n=1 Tax=Caenorhabditis elegans TaxID=6239 RepID=H2KYN4_CAEEL|nr:Transmembrane protein [Caenorhabditis elegans]CCD64015.1 Transmembrane protein [Caenorhabditis elegans]|eukprot:NP_501443.1 Uncharacterized protein CELE_C28C12.11 [Caenorhabditis elegans]